MLWSWQACLLVLCTFTAGDRIFSAFCIWEGGCIELLLILPEATREAQVGVNMLPLVLAHKSLIFHSRFEEKLEVRSSH